MKFIGNQKEGEKHKKRGLELCDCPEVSPVSAPVTLVVVGRGISEVSVTRAWLEDEEAPKLVELM